MGWQTIDTAPKDGRRMRVGHEGQPSSMKDDTIFPTFGRYDGGRWKLSSFFIIPIGRQAVLVDAPTHWLSDDVSTTRPTKETNDGE